MFLFTKNNSYQQQSVQGALLVLLSTLFFSLMGLGTRMARTSFRPDSLVFYRSLIQIMCLFPWVVSHTPSLVAYNRSRIGAHILRGIFGTTSMFLLYLAYRYLPLAFASLLAMTSVLWAAVFAWWLLHERWSARQLGFAILTCSGIVLSVIKSSPSVSWSYHPTGILAGLFCGILMALALVTMKKMTEELPMREIVFFFGLVGVVLTLPSFFAAPQLPANGSQFALLALVGLSGTIGQLFLTTGFAKTSAMIGSICNLNTIFINIVVGFLFLGEFPPITFFLSAVIVVVGLCGLLRASNQ